MNWKDTIGVFLIVGVITLCGNMAGYGKPLLDSLIGYFLLMIIILVGIAITRFCPVKLPMVFWISLLALLSTSGISPVAKFIIQYTNQVDFLAICTPILAYAGLAVGKDLEMFRKMSWKIVVVALAVYTGTFLCATMIAQFMLHLEGVI